MQLFEALLQALKRELEDQERALKASVGDQEKKAHECWVTARQAERKVTELQVNNITSRPIIAEYFLINIYFSVRDKCPEEQTDNCRE